MILATVMCIIKKHYTHFIDDYQLVAHELNTVRWRIQLGPLELKIK